MNFNSDSKCIKPTERLNFSNIRKHKGTSFKFGNPFQNLMVTRMSHDFQA